MITATSYRTTIVVTGAIVAAALTFALIQSAEGTDEQSDMVTFDLYLIGTDLLRNVTQPPEPGQRNFIAGDLYRLDDDAPAPAPEGEPVGRAVGLCTQITQQERLCSGLLNLDGRGTITVQLEVFRGINQGVAVTGGTGEFAGVTGFIIETPVPGHPDHRLNHVELSTSNTPDKG